MENPEECPWDLEYEKKLEQNYENLPDEEFDFHDPEFQKEHCFMTFDEQFLAEPAPTEQETMDEIDELCDEEGESTFDEWWNEDMRKYVELEE